MVLKKCTYTSPMDAMGMRFQVFAFLPVRSYGLPFALQAVRGPNKIRFGDVCCFAANLRANPNKKNAWKLRRR